MKKLCLMIFAVALLASCHRRQLTVSVSNDLDFPRAEVVQVPLSAIDGRCGTREVVITDQKGVGVPYQVLSDSTLAFLAEVGPQAKAYYKVRPGDPAEYTDLCTGRVYPERLDDMAWENDLVGFRAYGPALQQRGERGYGYDLFFKRGTEHPVVEQMILTEENPANWERLDSLRSAGRVDEADEFLASFSYHVDHGYGMDVYGVGPTLGAGVTALLDTAGIKFPWCYRQAEIIDRGPVRFSVRLTFEPTEYQGDTITEVRVITLDRASNLNRTDITYEGLSRPAPMVSGFVLHDASAVAADSRLRSMTYVDPTQGEGNGYAFMGLITPEPSDSIVADRALMHALAYNVYRGEPFTYYWGFGWDRGNMPDYAAWRQYVARRVRALDSPLRVAY